MANLIRRWRADPLAFVRETYEQGPAGQPLTMDPAQQEILLAVRDYDRVVARTGRGVGKTGGAAGFVIPWFVTTYYPALVVTAAGTWNHLKDKLWPEIRLWSARWLLRDAWEYQDLAMFNREAPDAWRVVASTSDDPEHVEGYHSPNLLLVIDEGKAMADELFTALMGSLTSNGGGVQKVLAMSTPPLTKGGWFSRISTSSEWKLIHVSGLDSPRVSRSYVDEIRRDYGEESPEYQSFVLGNIPEAASGAVIQARWVETQQRQGAKDDRRPAVVSCDVAREGEDLAVIGVIERARFNLVRFADDGRWGWWPKNDLMELAGRCMAAVVQHKAETLVIDDTGLGGGVTDRLRELQRDGKFPTKCTIVACKFGGEPRRTDRYHKLKDELWWTTREALRQGQVALPTDDEIRAWQAPRGSDFKAQITQPIYEYDSLDKIIVLDKRKAGKEKTKALPTKSPDLAHALILAVPYYLRHEQDPEPPKEQTPEEAVWSVVQENVQRAIRPPVRDPYRRQR